LTEFLYSGEQFDSKIGQQYLRARYYDPVTGRFNRLDPFFGNLNDPLSLHKYVYAHNDSINGIDPTGQYTIWSLLGGIFAGATIGATIGAGFGWVVAGTPGVSTTALHFGVIGGLIGLAAVIPTVGPIAGAIGVVTLVSWLYNIWYASTQNWHINKTTSHKKIAIMFGDMKTSNDLIGWGYGAMANLGYAFQGISVYGFAQALKDAGYEVNIPKHNPNEDEFVKLCNENDIVIVLAHGPGDFGTSEVSDSKNQPFAGFYLGGNRTHPDDRVTSLFTQSVTINDQWITANEINGKVTNPNLTFVAASCSSGITNRMGLALAGTAPYPTGYYVGHTKAIFATETEALFQYVVNVLNFSHVYAEQQLPDNNYKVNPTNAMFNQ
jgi:RHS repeat-associated protein